MVLGHSIENRSKPKQFANYFRHSIENRSRCMFADYLSVLTMVFSLKSNSTCLCNKRIQNYLILLYKSLFFNDFHAYMKDKFSLRFSSYDLRENCILSLSKPRTTSYALNSFFFTCQLSCGRNALPDFIRTTEFTGFKMRIPGRILFSRFS